MICTIEHIDQMSERQFAWIVSLMITFITVTVSFNIYVNYIQRINQCEIDRSEYYFTPNFHTPVNRQSKGVSPMLCVIARVNSSNLSYFTVFALSLLHTDLSQIRIFILNVGLRNELPLISRTIDFINDLVLQKDAVALLDLQASPSENSFSFGVKDQILNYFYDKYEKNSSTCQYLTITNTDSMYIRNFGLKILPFMKEKRDIIGWGFVSPQYLEPYREKFDVRGNFNPTVIDDGTEKCIPTSLAHDFVDSSAFAFRLEFLYKNHLHYSNNDGWYLPNADIGFIRKAANLTQSSIILWQTLVFLY